MEEKTTEDKKESTEAKEDVRVSGDDIIAFFRKMFRAGNSRRAVFKNEKDGETFRINLILLLLILFIIPVIALLLILFLIIMNHSISIEKIK